MELNEPWAQAMKKPYASLNMAQNLTTTTIQKKEEIWRRVGERGGEGEKEWERKKYRKADGQVNQKAELFIKFIFQFDLKVKIFYSCKQ